MALDAMLMQYTPHAYLFDGLHPEDFYYPEYRHIAALVKAVRSRGEEPNMISVYAESGDSEEAMNTMLAVLNSTPSFAGMETTVTKIKEKAKRRRFKAAVETALNDLDNDPVVALEQIIAETRLNKSGKKTFTQLKEALLADVKRPLHESRMPTGYTKLDGMIGWLPLGALIIIGARPSVGKTAFAINIIARVLKAGRDVMMASLEMSALQIMERFGSMMSGVGYQTINQHGLSQGDEDKLQKALALTDQFPGEFTIEDTLYTADSIIAKAAEVRPALMVVDFLQYIKCDGDSRSLAIAEVIRRFKQAARVYNMAVVVLSQLNRETDKATRPVLANLGESGAIEQGGDIIMFVHRPFVVDPTNFLPSYVELIVAKNKYGKTGKEEMYFAGETQRFTEVHKENGR